MPRRLSHQRVARVVEAVVPQARDRLARHTGRLAGRIDSTAEQVTDLAHKAAWHTARLSDLAAQRIADRATVLAGNLGDHLVRVGDRLDPPPSRPEPRTLRVVAKPRDPDRRG
ncbi:hypothetical protein SAMN05421810_104496 [Amycolatopsis arida]|uniref:Uncharacterized protein n=1 Tax=Amycolatopsis arida TaxID=587909 RepID=A0A1I5VSL7_9PSEU|nr:hypothetical protein [Amycolatopsis arida]TDX88009.1 hypothetical protein CLV69_112142 [Amycolatopsis arida]SFQ10450.1 hypothetical protein SAMN05421810_104496 [Amycolatopsis arida]